MNKLLLLTCILSITLVSAQVCNPSCNCAANSNVCISCTDANATIDQYARSCNCNAGYYMSQLVPFQCASSLAGGGNNSNNPTPVDPCLSQIGINTGDIVVDTTCFIDIDPATNGHRVNSLLDFDFSQLQNPMDDACKLLYSSIPYYLPFGQSTLFGTFVALPSSHWQAQTHDSNNNVIYGAIWMYWPLIQAYDYANAVTTLSGPDEFDHDIALQINIMAYGNIYRYHHYDLIVYTYRDEVQTFNLSVDKQQTADCTGQCIVIADLDVTGYVCQDHTCNTQRANGVNGIPQYTVGDTFYAKIWFKDSTYTKHLLLNRLYYLDSNGGVYDYTSLTTPNWSNQALIIALPLIDPSASNQIQVHMLIDPNSRFRRLQAASSSSNSANTASQTFSLSVLPAPASTTTSTTTTAAAASSGNTNATNTSGLSLLFGLFNLLALILLI